MKTQIVTDKNKGIYMEGEESPSKVSKSDQVLDNKIFGKESEEAFEKKMKLQETQKDIQEDLKVDETLHESKGKGCMITNPSFEMKIVQNPEPSESPRPNDKAQDADKAENKVEGVIGEDVLDFDVEQINVYKKYESEMTKKSIKQLNEVMQLLQTGYIAYLNFDWFHLLKESIFVDEINRELVPTLITLKKYCSTDEKNISLRQVIAKRLVTIKLAIGMLDQELIDNKSADLHIVSPPSLKSKDRGARNNSLKISFTAEGADTAQDGKRSTNMT